MQYVGRLVSSVYNNITPSINPATLSGAIDVIVVERQVEVEVDDDQDEQDGVGSSTPDNRNSNGNSNNKKKKKKMVTELASTPFHVRFGKMSVLRPAERKVTLHLNNSPDPLPFAMKVGEAGEAFFVLELDDQSYGNESIPEDLVTSPILSAASSPTLSATEGQEGRKEDAESLKKDLSSDRNSGNEVEEKKEDEDLEPLDLGAAESSGPSLTGGTGTDKAQEPSPSQSQDQEEEEEEDARSGTTEIRSRSSRSRSQDTNVTTPTSGAERSLSPDSQTRSNSQATGEISKHSKAKGYDQDTSVPSKAQPDPTSNTAEQTGPLSSLSNAASRASGVVSAAGRAIISPVTTTADKSDPTADGSKNSKLENLVKKKSGDGDKAPIEKEDDEMKSNWNSKSSEGQDNGGITKGAKKQERDEKKKEKKEGKQDRNEKVEDENLIERTEAEELEFQMQKRALNLVKAEQEASSPNQSSSKNEDEERAPSSSLAQVEDSKSEKKDDDQPISNALLAEEPFPKPFGTSSVPSSAESQTHPVQPRTSKTLGKDDEDDEELRAYLENNQNRNPISSLGIQDSIPPMDSKTRTETYPVSQPDHEKYLAGTLLGKESVDVGNGEVREVDKVMLDERVVKRKIEKEKEEMKNGKEEEKKAEEKKLSKSPKTERREDLQYMLDIDGYKMTADGEDLAFAEGHRFANEMPLSKKHGGNGKKAKITRYEDSALADDDDEEDVEGLVSGKGKSSSKRRASFARSSRSGHRTSRSMSRNRNGRNGSTSLSRKEGNSTRRDFKTSLSGNSAMGHHLQARLRTRRSSSSLLDDLTHELSSGDERPVLGLGANDEIGGTVEKESLSLSRDLARLARITRDNHHQTHHNQASRHSRRSNLSEGNLTPTSLIARRRTRSTKISGGPLGAGPRNRAKAAHGGHFKEFSYSDTEAEVPALRQKARRSRGKNLRNESAGLTLVKGKARLLNEGGDSSVPNTPAYTSFPKDDSQSFETDQTDREDLEDGERTPPAHPDSSLNNVNQSPEYEWGWGSLPKKKAQDEKDRRARVVSLGGSRAIRPDLDDEDQDENQVSSYDTAAVTTNNEEDEDPELSIDAINKANEKPPNGKLRSDDSDPYLFRLELDDASHEFELSLCFDETFGTSGGLQDQDLAQERDDYNFEENKISFQRFVDDQEVVDDERLVVRYNSRYLTWESASAVLATLSLYRKTLSAAEMDGADATAGNDGALDEDLNNQPRPSVWSRWWNRKGVPSSASTSNLQTEPQELDASGKEKSNSPPTPSLPHSLDRSRTDSLLETSNLPAGRPAGAAPSAARIAKDKADSNKKTYAKTLRLTSDQLKSLNLKKGANTITFSVTSSYSGVATCTARIFFWESFHRVVVSDIDGTITKSDALGHVFTMMGRDWTHLGVAKLYTDIARNGYRIMYLTSRAIGQADSTRDYLKGIKQNNYQLPDGPVIMSPDRLMASLHREVILRKPEVFKMACLRDIARLFGADPRHAQAQPGGQWPGVSKESLKAASGIGAGGESSPAGGAATSGISQDSKPSSDSGPSASNPSPDGSSKPQQPGQEQESQQEKEDPESSQQANPTPFYAGFGNRITDALSYRSVNIPSSRIFTIDSNGEVKMELLELAGYKSSYIHMTDLVDQMFPPITSRQELNPDKPEYNDFNFWRPSVVDIELPADEDLVTSPPVSPALSARSGKSLRSVRSNASLRSGTSDGSEYGHGRAQTEVAESGSTSSSSRLSRFGLGSLGLSRKSSAQTVANVPVSSRPTSSSSTNSTSTSVFTFPTGSSSSSYDQTAIPASSSAPDLTETWNGEDSTSSSPPSSYGRGVTGWSAPWRRSSRATSPSGTSNSGASGSQFRQATSPLVGPVITAEPEEDEDMAALSDDDVSNFGGDRDGNLDGKDGEENEREGSEDMGDDVLDQDEDGEEEELEEEEDDDPLLATGEIKFEWTK